MRRVARGIRNFDNYRLRALLAAGGHRPRRTTPYPHSTLKGRLDNKLRISADRSRPVWKRTVEHSLTEEEAPMRFQSRYPRRVPALVPAAC